MIFDDEELATLNRMIDGVDDGAAERVLDRLVVLIALLERKVNENCGVRDDD